MYRIRLRAAIYLMPAHEHAVLGNRPYEVVSSPQDKAGFDLELLGLSVVLLVAVHI